MSTKQQRKTGDMLLFFNKIIKLFLPDMLLP